ncbi:hypothetical protein GCM10007082_11150 [Oceanisphaera arctica]|nr:hypothetical protein GCM10007082_11150 [Oceanisphaera arctica]
MVGSISIDQMALVCSLPLASGCQHDCEVQRKGRVGEGLRQDICKFSALTQIGVVQSLMAEGAFRAVTGYEGDIVAQWQQGVDNGVD